MTRYLLALFLALTGLMVVAAPVALMAMSGEMLCEQRVGQTAQHAEYRHMPAMVSHDHHGAYRGAHKVADTSDAPSPDSAPVCCNHACGVELTVMRFALGVGVVSSGAPHDLSADNLTELTHPGGLRRPPKA